MYTGKTKKFKDTIHGYIEIPDIIVSNIIDTELFQRLHRVEQTSMRPLYPAARHDRFIHSLGVYWLGKEVFHKFRNNAINELKKDELVNDEFVNDYAWWDKQEILFTLACLLHDCAHAPFSHTLESLYTLRKTTVDKDIANQSKASVGERIADLDYRLIKICTSENIFDKDFPKDFLVEREDESEIKGVGSPHEKMSAYCAMKEYKQAIENIIVQMNKESSNKITLEKSDFVFIVRMIIGCTYSESSLCNSIKNCIISMLNSPAIDVDGLDYIVRDAYMSGIDSFNIDYQRLLSSFTIIPVDVYKNKYVGESETDNLNGTWLKDSIFLLTKMEDDKGSKTIKTGEINAEEIKGKIIIENIEYDEKENIISLGEKVEIEGRTYKTKSGARTKCDALQSGKITFVESCDVKKSRFKGEIIQGKRIVSQISPSRIDGAEREYILGYSKNSLSIIQSTVEARNYEYMWVYTHPKVLYNSNYLQWELVRDSAKYLCCCENNKDFNKKSLQ